METNSIIGMIPWPVAVVAAIWFGVMAHKSGKNRVVWAIGGGLLALVAATLVLGLGQATFIPFDSEEVIPFRVKAAVLAILLVVCLGWLFTGSLHQQLRASLKRTAAPAPEAPTRPPATSRKP